MAKKGKTKSSKIEVESQKGKSYSTMYPKKDLTSSEFKSASNKWREGQTATPEMKAEEGGIKEIKIKAVRLKASDVKKLREISESTAPINEAVTVQKMGPDQLLGTLFSSIAALEYSKAESELKKLISEARDSATKQNLENARKEIVVAFQQSYAAAGLKGIKEEDLKRFSRELVSNKANFDSVVKIANSGVSTGNPISISTTRKITGAFLPVIGVVPDRGLIGTTIAGLCSQPFAQGSFTKHFSKSFSLTVSLTVPCICYKKVWGVNIPYPCLCKKTFTIASVSFSVNLQVGYKVTCCGATAWGEVSARACATVVGISVCAECTARITGIAGLGRTGSGNNCIYGIGLNAQLKCTFAGITVLNLQVPFGYNVNGPCPPLGLCKK